MPTPCAQCGRPVPDPVPKCPFCGAVKQGAVLGQKPAPAVSAQPRPSVDPTPFLVAAREAPLDVRMPRALHFAMLLGALPLIVPSLLLTRLQAKRWGRVPIAFIVFDALLFLALAMAAPRVLPVFVVAIGCATALAVIRARHLGSGIYLGYDNLTTLLLSVAGVMVIIGSCQTFTLREVSAAVSDRAAREVTPLAITNHAVALGTQVRIKGSLTWAWRMQKVRSGERFTFVPASAGVSDDAVALWAPVGDTDLTVWVSLPVTTQAPPPLVGELTEPDPIDEALFVDHWRARHPGQSLSDTMYVVRLEGPPLPLPKAPTRNREGLLWLALGAVLALGTAWRATATDAS